MCTPPVVWLVLFVHPPHTWLYKINYARIKNLFCHKFYYTSGSADKTSDRHYSQFYAVIIRIYQNYCRGNYYYFSVSFKQS